MENESLSLLLSSLYLMELANQTVFFPDQRPKLKVLSSWLVKLPESAVRLS